MKGLEASVHQAKKQKVVPETLYGVLESENSSLARDVEDANAAQADAIPLLPRLSLSRPNSLMLPELKLKLGLHKPYSRRSKQ